MVLPSGKKVIFKKELTAGEVDDMEEALQNSQKVEIVDGEAKFGSLDIGTKMKMRKYQELKLVIKEIDGVSNIDDNVLRDLSMKDRSVLEKESDKILKEQGVKEEEKKRLKKTIS